MSQQLWFGLRLCPKHHDWIRNFLSTLPPRMIEWDDGDQALDIVASAFSTEDSTETILVFIETWEDRLEKSDLHSITSLDPPKRVFTAAFEPTIPTLDKEEIVQDYQPIPLVPLIPTILDEDIDRDAREQRLLTSNLQFYMNYPQQPHPRTASSVVHFDKVVTE